MELATTTEYSILTTVMMIPKNLIFLCRWIRAKSRSIYSLLLRTMTLIKNRYFWSVSQKVAFIVVGTQKGGTSALHKYLKNHPEVCMAHKKEVHFFNNDKYFFNKEIPCSTYHSYFSPNKKNKVLGEATPDYMFLKDIPERIWNYNPKIKLIILLRNPIERAYSQWNMNRAICLEPLSFLNALMEEEKRRRKKLPHQDVCHSYIKRGQYLQQLRQIWRFFPKNQTLVIKSQELKTNPKDTLDEVCKFLGIRKFKLVKPMEFHTRRYLPMSSKERKYLINLFRKEIANLEKELSWDCSDWIATEEIEKCNTKKKKNQRSSNLTAHSLH